MKFEEIEDNEIYEVDGFYHHQVIHKHYESKTVFTLEVGSDYPVGWAEDELHFFSPISLPKTGLLVSKSGSIVYRTGESSGYGFSRGKYWYDSANCGEFTPDYWRKATLKDEIEFEKLIIKEAAKRGLVDGVEFESAGSGLESIVSTMDTRFNREGIIMGKCYIFFKGKWATPIKNEKQDELDSTIEKLFKLAEELGIEVLLTLDNKEK